MKNDKILFVEEFVTKKVYDKIVSKYPKSTQLVLGGNYDKLEIEFPNIIDRLNSCSYNKDKRTMEEYAINLASSWVLENYVLLIVNYYTGRKISLAGGDVSREFQRILNVTTASDFIMKDDLGNDVYIEFITDNFGYFNKIGKFFLRDKKLEKLRANSIKGKTMILSLNIKDKTFFLQDVNDMRDVKTERWGKPSSEVKIDFETYKLSKDNLIEQFKKINN